MHKMLPEIALQSPTQEWGVGSAGRVLIPVKLDKKHKGGSLPKSLHFYSLDIFCTQNKRFFKVLKLKYIRGLQNA